jgi:probable HAF family extracellular repeat protein
VGGSFLGPDPDTSQYHATVWDPGGPHDLGTLTGGGESHAWDVSASGLIVGVAQTAEGYERPVLWRSDTLDDLGALGGDEGAARAINALGSVVGTARTPDGSPHAFLWQDGTMQDLGLQPGWLQSRAHDISDSGDVVGAGMALLGDGPTHFAVLWRDGLASVLDDLVPAQTGWHLSVAWAINRHGEIVGQGVREARERAFLLIPEDRSNGYTQPGRGRPGTLVPTSRSGSGAARRRTA